MPKVINDAQKQIDNDMKNHTKPVKEKKSIWDLTPNTKALNKRLKGRQTELDGLVEEMKKY
jgi:guanylate kinase